MLDGAQSIMHWRERKRERGDGFSISYLIAIARARVVGINVRSIKGSMQKKRVGQAGRMGQRSGPH